MHRGRRPVASGLVGVLLLVGCSGPEQAGDDAAAAADPEPADEADADPDPQDAAPVAEDEEIDLATWRSQRPECEQRPDRTVTHLEPVVVPAVDVPAVEIPEQVVGDEVVEAVTVPAQRIAQQVVDTGCIVEHDAPAGCLGRVEISGFEIPPVEIPAVEIPGASVGDRGVDGRGVDRRGVDARGVDARVVEERCQREPSSGQGVVAAVVRPAIVRPAAVRPAVVRPAVVRPAVCTTDGCVEAVSVPAVAVQAVAVEAVAVQAEVLEAYVLEGTDAERIDEDDRTSYLAPADVLFAFDESELTDEAIPTLERIAEELAALGDAPVVVEGHTDGVGTDAYNQRLSEERAQAVADWLATEGGIDAERLSTRGYGASNPVAEETTAGGADDPEGRALNRRVVISVATG